MLAPDVEALKRKALTGSISAVHDLEERITRKELSLFDVQSTIVLLLSLEHADDMDSDDWASSPAALIIVSCFGMVAAGFNEPRVTDHPQFLTTIFPDLWTLSRKWCTRFIHRTRVLEANPTLERDLELTELVDRIIASASPHLQSHLSKKSRNPKPVEKFLNLLTRLWFRCMCTSRLPTLTYAYFLTNTTLQATENSSYYQAVRLAMTRDIPSYEVSSALAESHMALTFPAVHLESAHALAIFTRMALNNDISCSGIAFYTARLLRQLSSRRAEFIVGTSDRSLAIDLTLQNIKNLQKHGYSWAAGAMKGHVIHALLNTQIYFQAELESAESYEKLVNIMDALQPFLMWPTIQVFIRHELASIARTDVEKLLHPYSPLTKSFRKLKDDQAALRALRPHKHCLSSCSNCGCFLPVPRRKLCTCRQSVYCSKSCQHEDWEFHKDFEPHSADTLGSRRRPLYYLSMLSSLDNRWIHSWTDYLLHSDTEFRSILKSYEDDGDKDTTFIVVDYHSYVENLRPTVVVAPMENVYVPAFEQRVMILAPGLPGGIPSNFRRSSALEASSKPAREITST